MHTASVKQDEANMDGIDQCISSLTPSAVVELKPLPDHLSYKFLET